MASYSTFDAFKQLAPTEDMYVLSEHELHDLQHALVEMLDDVRRALEKHGIEWMLSAGSVLGAIRHQGFIPWDDDLDIAMFRDGYEKFKEVFSEELGAKYVLQDPLDTPGYDLAISRIRKRGTVLRCRDDFFVDEDCGIYIDIDIWDAAPSSKLLQRVHGFFSLGIGFAYSCRRFAKYGDNYLKLAGDNAEIAHVFRNKIRIGKLLSFASAEAWTKLWYRWNKLCKNQHSTYVVIPAARIHYFGLLVERSMVSPAKTAVFDGVTARVPNDADAYLKRLYGDDYMTPPTEAGLEKHVVLAFDLGSECSSEQ